MIEIEEERRLTEHLSRASELLRSDKLDEAEAAVGEALKLNERDLRARNLRGLVLFRAGRYEEARSVYTHLQDEYPDDAAILLNLGLVELRMGRHLEAALRLRKVVAAEPENERAQGYLGLALMRTGDLAGARDAFHKGKQSELARQVEEKMAQSEEVLAARTELRHAAREGAQLLQKEQPFAPVELETPVDEERRALGWQLRSAGERPPAPGPEGMGDAGAVPLKLEPAKTVAAFATERLLRPGALGDPFALAQGGLLVLRIDGKMPTRTYGAVASTGLLAFEPLMRRVRGHATEEPFGEGGEAMFLATGKGLMVVTPRGGQFTLLALSDDIVYVREHNVFSFDDSVSWESGRMPGTGQEVQRVVQFRGHGRVAIRTERAIYTLKVEGDAPLFVDASTLLGWIGRVVPRTLQGPDGKPTAYVEASGEGVLMLETPA